MIIRQIYTINDLPSSILKNKNKINPYSKKHHIKYHLIIMLCTYNTGKKERLTTDCKCEILIFLYLSYTSLS